MEKVAAYSAGYAKEELLKKCAAGALGAVMLGGMVGCTEPTYDGNMSYQELDGAAVCVSESDVSESDCTDEKLPYEGKVVTQSAGSRQGTVYEEIFLMLYMSTITTYTNSRGRCPLHSKIYRCNFVSFVL